MMTMKLVLLLTLSATLVLVECADLPSNGMRGKTARGRTTIHRRWYGGFVGEFDIEIKSPATSWEAEINFPRDVFELRVSNADVEKLNNRKYRLQSTCGELDMQPGDKVSGFFIADTFQKVKGLKADIKVTPYFQIRT